MKLKVILAAGLALVCQLVIAGEITDTYSAGDTLTTTILDNIKTAVNDNDATKQDLVTGTCPAGQSIRVINSNGTVTCEEDTDTQNTYSAGSGLSLTGTTFSISSGNIVSVSSSSGVPHNLAITTITVKSVCGYIGKFMIGTGLSTTLVVPIQIPHNAIITEFRAIICDVNSIIGSTATLYRSDAISMAVVQTTEAESSTTVFTKMTDTISNPVVDNLNYSYFVYMAIDGTAGPTLVPISAIVSYTLP